MDEVVATWNAAYGPVRSQVESINMIARGKGLREPLNLDTQTRKPSLPSEPRRTSSGLISSTNNGPQPRALRMPSMTSLRQPATPADPSPSPVSKRPDYLAPTDFTTATILGGAAVDRVTPGPSPGTMQARDYFSNRDRPSAASINASAGSLGGYTPTGNGFVKKKAPPPPPPKRFASTAPDEFVVAQFTFNGQGQGDLSFREGDRIKIVKKTGTDQDWWVGELNGAKGNFPANYCKPV